MLVYLKKTGLITFIAQSQLVGQNLLEIMLRKVLAALKHERCIGFKNASSRAKA